MKNREIARILSDIADFLEIKGEIPFKTRAYRKAVSSIEHLPVELEVLARQGKLREVPGVGEAIAKKITELLETGRLEYYERLRAEFPPGVTALLDVPGIGPKTAMRLAADLGVCDVKGLEAAILDGKVSALFRMGDKSAENILKHIQAERSRERRTLIGEALPLAETIIGSLKERFDLPNLTPAGSLRRHKETVRDIDLMCTADNPEDVIEAFTGLPLVMEVTARGGTKASIISASGLQVDLRVVEHADFGSLLQHFTGSKEHNVALRERAQKQGLKVSEYGIAVVSTGKVYRFTREEDVYRHLGLSLIPPEIREGGPEIEMAEAGRIPELVRLEDLRGDLHVHSKWSDGRDSLETLAEAGRSLGYEYMAVTDHSKGRGIARGLNEERLLEQIERIREINGGQTGFRLLSGIEVDIRADGSLDLPDEVLSRLDIVIAAVHSSLNQDADRMTARLVKAMENPHVDIIAHPTCRILGEREPVLLDLDTLFRSAGESGTALEVNSMPDRLDLRDAHIYRAREMGVKLVIDTDAHRTEQLGLIRYGVGMARRGWCTRGDILNTLRLPELLAALKKGGLSVRLTDGAGS